MSHEQVSDLHYVASLGVEFWTWLCRVSWNPLFGAILGGIFGGIFALLGAIIGGRYVLRSMDEQRRRDRLAAGRALSAELELNIASAVTLVVAGRNKPRDYLIWRPSFSRRVFDDRLTLLSELLTPSEFLSLTSIYATAAASFLLLEAQARRGVEFTPGAVKKFMEHAEEFAIASRVVAIRVWPEAEQERLKLIREKLVEEMHAIWPPRASRLSIGYTSKASEVSFAATRVGMRSAVPGSFAPRTTSSSATHFSALAAL
jgi:hypothetical protein